jgi:hypothetical protein
MARQSQNNAGILHCGPRLSRTSTGVEVHDDDSSATLGGIVGDVSSRGVVFPAEGAAADPGDDINVGRPATPAQHADRARRSGANRSNSRSRGDGQRADLEPRRHASGTRAQADSLDAEPNLIRLDQIGPRDTYVLYYDGGSDSGWEILPDIRGSDPLKTVGKAVELTGGELKFAQGYLSGFQFNMWMADRTPGFTVTSPAPNVVRIVHDGDANDFTLDPATWLPVKTAGISLANPDRPVQAELRYEAWTEVAGVRFPTKRANYHNGVKLGEITDAVIHVNGGLAPRGISAPPRDFMPDIPR